MTHFAKSVFFPYKNHRPTVRIITDFVTADTKSGRQIHLTIDIYEQTTFEALLKRFVLNLQNLYVKS
jgi:cell division protein FtsI/penicillin-binding protein 2